MISQRKWAGHLKTVNAMMINATPVGAYCLGLATAAGSEAGWLPTRSVMNRLLECTSIEEGEAMVSRLVAGQQRKKEKRTT